MKRARGAAAGLLLLATWVTLLAACWILFVVEPRFLPAAYFLPALSVIVVFGATLVLAARLPALWRLTIRPRVPVPGWLVAGGILTTGLVVLLASWLSLALEQVLWIAAVGVGVTLAASAVSDRRWLNAGAAPGWLVVAGAVVVGSLLAISVFLPGNALLNAAFFLALLLVFFHVGFLLPLTFWQAITEERGWTPDPPVPVSVLIPAYNEARVVGGCIEAVLASTYPSDRLEVIVIDDGSTDGTFREAEAYRDRGVQVYRRENGGKYAALNYGLQCASGELIVTVDADSRPAREAISRMVGQLQSDERIGALSAPVVVANDAGVLGRLQRLEYAISNTNRRAYSVFGAVPVVPGCLGVYRAAALRDVWGYDPDTVAEDFDLTFDLLKHGWRVRHGTGVVRTIAPATWRELWHQRLRWYRGGLETLRKHLEVLADPRFGYLHALIYPTRYVSHAMGPILSYVIIVAVVWEFLVAPTAQLVALAAIFLLLTGLLGLYATTLERESPRLAAYAPLLFVGYKHFVDLTKAVGNVRAYLPAGRW